MQMKSIIMLENKKDLRILFKFTTRSRPHLFERGMQSIIQNVTNENYQILVSVDTDDTTMPQALYKYENDIKVKICYGTSKNKIDAINRDVEKADEWHILINMSDDMVFVCRGFDDTIRDSFDNLKQCLHFPDGNTNQLITMSVIGREFYDRFGYIYNPEYVSLWCDNEQMEVAKLIYAYKYVDMLIFNHLHPAFAKAELDNQYRHTESFYGIDGQTFERRKAINFGL